MEPSEQRGDLAGGVEECGNCRYCVKKECHRHSPEGRGNLAEWLSWWPTVMCGDWCGEWQEREIDVDEPEDPNDPWPSGIVPYPR